MRTLAALAIVALDAISGHAQADSRVEPFVGAWALDGARSHYAREAPPERMTLVIEAAADGLAYRSDSYFSGGRVAAAHFVARLDATPALVVGAAGFLAPVSLTVAEDGGIDAVYTSGLKKVAWSHWSVTADGSELVITTAYLDSKGQRIDNVAVFRRTVPGSG